jgi:hypothetical protein
MVDSTTQVEHMVASKAAKEDTRLRSFSSSLACDEWILYSILIPLYEYKIPCIMLYLAVFMSIMHDYLFLAVCI